MDELQIIKKFYGVLYSRCVRHRECGCANFNNCGMAKLCHKGFRLNENEVDKLYDIYLKDNSEYFEELEFARELKSSGIDLKKLEELIEKIGELK